MKTEQYQDMIARIFPHPGEENSHHIITATIQVTDACNLACTYCYQINKHHHIMEPEVGKKFIDMLLNNSNGLSEYYKDKIADGIILEFIGGEPFLAIDLIDEASSKTRLDAHVMPDEIKELEAQIEQLSKDKEEAIRTEAFEEAGDIKRKQLNKKKQLEEMKNKIC